MSLFSKAQGNKINYLHWIITHHKINQYVKDKVMNKKSSGGNKQIIIEALIKLKTITMKVLNVIINL